MNDEKEKFVSKEDRISWNRSSNGINARPILLIAMGLILSMGGCEDDSGPGTTDDQNRPPENAVSLTSNVEDILPRWSSVGDKIVFQRNGYIFVLDARSGLVSRIAEGRCPVFSFNAEYIV